jgi:hypothetical protein
MTGAMSIILRTAISPEPSIFQPVQVGISNGIMEDFVKVIEQEIMRAFNGEEYENERSRIIKDFRDKKDELVMQLSQEAQERAFG